MRYGISAARPSARAAAKAAAIRATPVEAAASVSGIGFEAFQVGDRLREILVATAAQADHVDGLVVGSVLRQEPGDRVTGLERRDDPLEARKLAEGANRIVVGDRH